MAHTHHASSRPPASNLPFRKPRLESQIPGAPTAPYLGRHTTERQVPREEVKTFEQMMSMALPSVALGAEDPWVRPTTPLGSGLCLFQDRPKPLHLLLSLEPEIPLMM